jgi:hypothetical protein
MANSHQAIAKDQRIAIADFELSVEKDLESWVAASINNDDAPDVIASCIQQYFAGAKDLYGTNAEDNSIMILTIMDLWVALDTFAIRQCPLTETIFSGDTFRLPPSLTPSSVVHLESCLAYRRVSMPRHKEACNAYIHFLKQY